MGKFFVNLKALYKYEVVSPHGGRKFPLLYVGLCSGSWVTIFLGVFLQRKMGICSPSSTCGNIVFFWGGHSFIQVFLGGPNYKESTCNAGDLRDVCSILVLGRSPGGGLATHSSILAWRIP